MQKKKIFLIFSSIAIICLVSLSAQCGIQREAPTVELEIYDGPDYSESDNMCYYRVEAIISGAPEPEVEFSDDDNVSELGNNRVEAGVEIDGSYTLVVTATNAAGTATASVILSGKCSDEVSGDEEAGDEEAEDEDEDATVEEEETTEEEEGEGTAPTIALEIYEGPTPADGLCFYRVKATVTGSPSPAVTWSKDDSGGAWGSRKAQVNLSDPAETYTLTATATNSKGTATASITLDWGCSPPEPEETETNVPVVSNEAGYIIWSDAITYPHNSIFAGDSITETVNAGAT
jgi:hypothetical protein